MSHNIFLNLTDILMKLGSKDEGRRTITISKTFPVCKSTRQYKSGPAIFRQLYNQVIRDQREDAKLEFIALLLHKCIIYNGIKDIFLFDSFADVNLITKHIIARQFWRLIRASGQTKSQNQRFNHWFLLAQIGRGMLDEGRGPKLELRGSALLWIKLTPLYYY